MLPAASPAFMLPLAASARLMDVTTLGDTGLQVSSLSLGAGGASKLGLNDDRTEDEAVALVEQAIEFGINTFDTAPVYDTEPIIGRALADHPRDEFVISTKFSMFEDGEMRPAGDLAVSLEESLDRLQTDYVDVFHLHGVNPEHYRDAADRFLDAMHDLKDDGLIRAVGITETTGGDPAHEALGSAVEDDGWDVMMVGFNLINQSARELVFEPATAKGIGIMGMIPVRRALTDEAILRDTIDDLIDRSELDPSVVDREDPFGFLRAHEDVESVIEAAYRFACHEPSIDTLLCGTGNPAHLAANVAAVERGPLPSTLCDAIDDRFGRVTSRIGNN